MSLEVRPYAPSDQPTLLQLSKRAWAPVFEQMRISVPVFVYNAFYPNGWWTRQREDIERLLDEESNNVLVAVENGTLSGWVGVRLHPEDMMGEVYILAVDPGRQRRGVATALMDAAFTRMRDAGASIAMVETGDDPGHAASRATYESAGFERWPVARYFREL